MYKISPRLITICPDKDSNVWAWGLNIGLEAYTQSEQPDELRATFTLTLSLLYTFVFVCHRLRRLASIKIKQVFVFLFFLHCFHFMLCCFLEGLMKPCLLVIIHLANSYILIISNFARLTKHLNFIISIPDKHLWSFSEHLRVSFHMCRACLTRHMFFKWCYNCWRDIMQTV